MENITTVSKALLISFTHLPLVLQTNHNHFYILNVLYEISVTLEREINQYLEKRELVTKTAP